MDQSYEFNNIESYKADFEKHVGDQMNFIELDLAENLKQDRIRLKQTYLFSEKHRENHSFVFEKRINAHS